MTQASREKTHELVLQVPIHFDILITDMLV